MVAAHQQLEVCYNTSRHGALGQFVFGMTMRKILIIILQSSLSYTVCGQSDNPYEIIRALASQMDSKHPIVDSLCPFVISSFTGREWNGLTAREKRKLMRAVKKGMGIKLTQDSLPSRKLIPSSPLFEAFANPDSWGIRLIEQQQPFYMLSHPLFFAGNTKAIVTLILIRGFSYTYIFERRDDNWVMIESIYGSM